MFLFWTLQAYRALPKTASCDLPLSPYSAEKRTRDVVLLATLLSSLPTTTTCVLSLSPYLSEKDNRDVLLLPYPASSPRTAYNGRLNFHGLKIDT